MPREDLIELRYGTGAHWTVTNPTLSSAEPGFEIDTHRLKVGDGVSRWATLPYVAAGGGVVFEHTQSTPATVWTATHNMGFKPAVEVLDQGGVEVICRVVHVSVNQFQVHVNPAMSGTARAT